MRLFCTRPHNTCPACSGPLLRFSDARKSPSLLAVMLAGAGDLATLIAIAAGALAARWVGSGWGLYAGFGVGAALFAVAFLVVRREEKAREVGVCVECRKRVA